MSEDIGQLLRQAREARSLTLEEAAYNTRIRAHYLRAIEAGDYRSLPSQAQGRGFLRTYAAFLGIDPLPLLAELDAGTRPAPPPSVVTTAAPPATPQVASEEANAIFRDIGESLRKQREVLGLALEDVERNTHLRMHYLKSLEAGDYR